MRRLLTMALLLPGLCAAQSPDAPAMSAAECEVYARENSFAESVARGDPASFAEHLHPQAVFLDGASPARGRAAVVQRWTPILAGTNLTLRWQADEVVIGGDLRVAFSRGPYLLERRAAGSSRFQIGTFSSVWTREADGAWRVLYDGGVGAQDVDSREQAEQHLARATPKCGRR